MASSEKSVGSRHSSNVRVHDKPHIVEPHIVLLGECLDSISMEGVFLKHWYINEKYGFKKKIFLLLFVYLSIFLPLSLSSDLSLYIR